MELSRLCEVCRGSPHGVGSIVVTATIGWVGMAR